MVHAISASYLRSERMSPPALLLAMLLHALVAFALWGLAHYRTFVPPAETAIEVTIEKPKPPPAPPQTPPLIEGLRPPAPIVSDKPTQIPTHSREAEPLPPQSAKIIAPEPLPPPARMPEPPRPAPVPPAHDMVVPPANPLPRPSPLNRPQQRQAATTVGPDQPEPSRFVNPADVYNRARVQDNYLWEVVRKLRGYQYRAHVTAEWGLTVVRIVIARDGRLLDAEVVRSSGVPEMDRGAVAGVRAGSPYTPLPDSIHGPSATFTLPLVSSINR